MIIDWISQLPSWLSSLLLLIAAYLFSFIFKWVFFQLLRFYGSRKDNIWLNSLQQRLKSTTFLFISFVALYFLIDLIPLDDTLLRTLKQVLEILIIISISVVIARYTLPVDALREKFDQALASTDLWDGEGKSVQVTDTSENTMTIRLLMTAKNSPIAWELRCLVREELISFIQKEYPNCLPRTRAQLTNQTGTNQVGNA